MLKKALLLAKEKVAVGRMRWISEIMTKSGKLGKVEAGMIIIRAKNI
ncbi:MAG: hypothetical protein WC848_06840 [Parcubacteria group bacterium]|jgi:hypothetical protein